VRALGLRHALSKAQSMIDEGHRNVAQIESAMHDVLNKAPVDSIDYAAIVDPDTMEQRSDLDSPAVAIIAARVGTTRLIDNSLLRIQ
jgi:pantoate--beta-alanine ligase